MSDTRSRTRGAQRFLVLALLAPCQLLAQSASVSPAADSSAARARSVFAEQPAYGREGLRVLLALPRVQQLADPMDSLAAATMLKSCAATAPGTSIDPARPTLRQPTTGEIREAVRPLSPSDSVTVVIAATSIARRTCEWVFNESPTALWNGVAFWTERARMPEPTSLLLYRDGSALSGVVAHSRDARWDGAAWDTLGTRLALRLPTSALGPRSDGTLPEVRVYAARDSGASPQDQRIAAAELRRLAFAVVAQSLAAAPEVPSGEWLQHPSARARAVLDTSDRRPLLDAMHALTRDRVSTFADRDEPVAATVRAAHALFLAGDSASARMLLRDLSPAYPCLSVATMSESAVGRALAGIATANNCVPSDARRLLMRGLIAPGGAAWMNHGRGGGAFSSALIAASFGMALQSRRASDDSYTQYLAARSYSSAVSLYQQSVEQQGAARRWAIGGVALWVADAAAEAAWGWAYSRWRITHDRF